MGRPRKKNKHLPRRVYLESGRYWFKPRKPKPTPPDWKPRIDLGTTLAEMYVALSKLVDTTGPLPTMAHVFDKYTTEILPGLAPRTQKDYLGYIENLRPPFGDAPAGEVSAGDIFDYRKERAKSSIWQANREVSCLSGIFREAIGWHCGVERNPCHELKRIPEPERTRYVDDAESSGVYGIASPMYQCAMDIITITSIREGDLLRLPCHSKTVYTDEGIKLSIGKSQRRHPRHGKVIVVEKFLIVEWSDELHEVIERARSLGPQLRPTLICNLQGEQYSESGFRSNWARLMHTALHGRKLKNRRVTLAPVLEEPFTVHDLRAKSLSDEEDVMVAYVRSAHEDIRTTQKTYRRKPRRAKPGRRAAV